MIDDIVEKLKWLIILFPGFLSLGLVRYISSMNHLSEFELVFYSFGFTIINLIIATLLYKLGGLIAKKIKKGQLGQERYLTFYVLVAIISIFIGIVAGIAYENDWTFRLLRIGPGTTLITKRGYQRPLTFLLSRNIQGKFEEGRPEAMKTTEAWVKIRLTSGETYEGYPEFFSMGEASSEVFLSPACRWIKKGCQDKIIEIDGPGILIFEKDIKYIEFLDRPKSECHNLWKRKNAATKASPS